jgi:hypothetical protein
VSAEDRLRIVSEQLGRLIEASDSRTARKSMGRNVSSALVDALRSVKGIADYADQPAPESRRVMLRVVK